MKENLNIELEELEDLLSDESFISWVKQPNAESDHYWDRWLKLHPLRQDHLKQARLLVGSTAYRFNYQIAEDDYNRSLLNIISYKRAKQPQIQARYWRPMKKMFKYAASIILIVGATLFFKTLLQDHQQPEVVQQIAKRADYGQKKTVTLPDGSVVKLNAGSELRFAEHFTTSKRHVELSGEAFFDITRDETRPFVINSGEVDVRVLGTSFVVKSYPEESEIMVAVRSGKVEVVDPLNKENLLLVKDEIAIYERGSKRLNRGIVHDQESFFGWMNQDLVFDDYDFDEIITILKRWYGIDFQIDKKMETSKRITAKFENPTLRTVLTSLSIAYEFEFEINKKTVIIK